MCTHSLPVHATYATLLLSYHSLGFASVAMVIRGRVFCEVVSNAAADMRTKASLRLRGRRLEGLALPREFIERPA